ncbi:hypothetical protein K457DRAFT_34750 [Linnemannia elongata AG-77]|uniref:Uncharacterized protein n=1 Tax=Linnemannia elongata AG-77 TaxID=1314771 RepID=A0A197JMA0_9FUNG|nr:hypothetical protein K457DRAFT_34750 [Linnemannia elongata AG-77]
MPLWLRQYITQRQKRDPATLAEPRNFSVQQSFHRILHPTSITTTTPISNHATPQSQQPLPSPSIRHSKFPFSSTPSMFKALGPRDMDILNSQEIVRLAIYVMKRSSIELADPVLCEKVHTEGEKRRAAAAASAAATGGDGGTNSGATGALKRVSSIESSSRRGDGNTTIRSNNNSNNTNKGNTNNTNITASSIYLTKDFDIGNSLLHHRSKRPSRSLESVLSIATFCARASNPSARRASAGSSNGASDNGKGSNNSKGGDGKPLTTTTVAAAMVGAKWLAKLGQVVFGGPCAQAGHSHHRRTRHSPDLLDPRSATTTTINTNESNSSGTSVKGATAAVPIEKLCKHCSGAMTCLAISILREASSSSSTDSALSGQGREIGGRVSAKNLPAPPLGARNAGATPVQDSGFESGASGLELLDAQSDDIASDASSSSSSSLSSPSMSSSSLPSSETVMLRHGQSSYATTTSASREESQRTTNKDYRPRLELKHKTRIRPRTEGSGGSTPRMAASPSPSGGSPYIVFDRSHQNDTVIRHPLKSDTSAQQQAGQGQEQDLYEEESGASESGAWTPSSVLSDSLAEDFAPDVTAGGDWRSNMYASTGTRTPRDEDLDDDGMDSLPLGQRVKTRLERDLAEALGTPVIDEPMSFSSSPFIAQPAQPPLSPPQPRATATAVPLVPSIRRPSITGLGIHTPVVRSNSNGYTASDDGEEEVFHQAIDHFIHPLSTSPHQRVSPQTTTTAITPGASPTPTPALTNAIKSPGTTTPPPTFLQPSPSNYSSPPSSPAPVSLAVLANPTKDDVATPLLPPASGDDEKKKKEEEEEEQGAESPKTRPFYGVGIHGRVSVDEYAQEVGESIQKKVPPMDLGRGLALPSVDDDDDERKEEEKLEEVALERPVVNVVAPTGDEYSHDTDRPVVEVDDVEDVEAVDSPHTTTTATAEKEEPTSTERRLSTLRYGGVGLHALTPSDEYVQDIEEAMQRLPPVDLSRPYFDSEDEKEEEEGDDRGETKNPAEEQKVDKVRDEDEVQTDDEATEATTTVSSAIDRIEDDSLAAAEVKNHISTALRYGAVGLHGKTPFDEYAQEIEESIQRGAQAREGEYLEGVERRSDEEEDRVAAHMGDKKDATNKPLPPSISTRPLSSVYARGPPTDSSFDYSSSSDNLDSYDSSNPSSPSSPFPSSPSTTGTTPQTAVQKELRDLRRASQRRRKIQLVDDAQRKKEQLARIREQLERKALGKIREQVSFWETKGVLEQKVVGAEEVVVEDDGDDGGEGGANTSESENKDPSPGGLLSLSQEHLRGGRSGNKKSSGEPMSPGNSQSPGGYYSEMPQLAPRRSLSTTSSTNDKIHSQVGSRPSSTPKPSEIDVFLSNVD